MPIRKELFQHPASDDILENITLSNESGGILSVINYGATITGIQMPNENGQVEHVVLGLPKLESYVERHPYFGATVGRVAGRISEARYMRDGSTYLLTANEGAQHLHGGVNGLDKKLWQVQSHSSVNASDPWVTLVCQSVDGEEGYPGNLEVFLTYRLTRENTVRIEIQAETDYATPFCPTNHAYFNLEGDIGKTIEDHYLAIDSDCIVPVESDYRLSGDRTNIDGLSCDFRTSKKLNEYIYEPSYGEFYLLSKRKKDSDGLAFAARLEAPISGRALEVWTTENGLQVYTAKFLDEYPVPSRDGSLHEPYAAICLECQGYPDGVNRPDIDDTMLHPRSKCHKVTEYRFSSL